MNTLHGIRRIALVATLAAGALIASATQAVADRSGEAESGAVADLGHITVLARRDIPVANLGSLTVTAPRLSRVSFADLGAITVTASRIADARVADLGALTVTAKRPVAVTVATAEGSSRFWK